MTIVCDQEDDNITIQFSDDRVVHLHYNRDRDIEVTLCNCGEDKTFLFTPQDESWDVSPLV